MAAAGRSGKSGTNWLFLDCFNTLLDEDDGLTHESGMAPIWHLPVEAGVFPSTDAFHDAYLAWRDNAWSGDEHSEILLHERLAAVGCNTRLAAEMVETFVAEYPATLRPTPGIEAALDELSHHYRLAVVSNFFLPDVPERLLTQFGLADAFEFVVDSAQVGFKKPDTRLYRNALERAETEPANVTFIGDNRTNDAQAPAELGMRGIWFRRQAAAEAPEGLESFTSWSEAAALLC